MASAHLLYLACGTRDVAVQALYGAYSAFAYKGPLDLAVHISTDQPQIFHPLADQLHLHELTREKVQAWRGPGNYPYRLKIAALAELASELSDQRILFADSDSFFFADFPSLFLRIDARNAVLHRKEYSVPQNPTRQLERFRERMGRFRFRGNTIDLSGDMWNSGAIGLHPSQFHLLTTILAFIDAISPQYKKQLVEQYAVSYYLQKNATLHPCDDFLFHYWSQKREYQQEIEARVERWRSMPLQAAWEELRQNRIVLPPFAPRHGLLRRLSDRVFGSDEVLAGKSSD
jgi:hypothetical protein